MTEPRIRYWRHVTSTDVTATCDDDACGKHTDSRFYIDTEGWVEVTVTPVVTGDVIEQAARMLHTLQWDGEQEDAESAWDHYPILAVARQEYLRTAEALADAGLLVGPCEMTPEQIEEIDDALSDYGRECENSVTSFRAPTPDLRTTRERILSALGFTYGGGGE